MSKLHCKPGSIFFVRNDYCAPNVMHLNYLNVHYISLISFGKSVSLTITKDMFLSCQW